VRVLLLMLLVACTPSEAAKNRTPAVPKDSPHYDLFEGTHYKNDCTKDGDCHAAGCGKEVCSAESKVMSPCIAYPDQPRDATCGCVEKQCVWYK